MGLEGAPWALTAVGPYLFITTLLNALYVVDITTPSQPRLLSTASYGGAGAQAVAALSTLPYAAVAACLAGSTW